MIDRAKLLKLLKVLYQIAETASDEELAELERAGMAALRSSNRERKKSKTGHTKLSSHLLSPDQSNIREILESLKLIHSREDGFAILERYELTKPSLEAIARIMDLPVQREDNSKKLMEKIIEGSVGSRLRSEAIRGNPG